ncbi:MAG: PIN domain-containing protein [Actinomycetota bacterium]|nr:PIN domain-containing protein [Actinomycetota bacterium]
MVWYLQGSPRLSGTANAALSAAETTDGVVVSVATLIDLWYVTKTTLGVTDADLARLRDLLASSSAVSLHPIDVAVVDATTSIPRDVLTDPWDRFIVGTARALGLPLVTKDASIRESRLVPTIW